MFLPFESGHGSLATAAVLFTHYHPKAESIHFETKKRGHLIARRNSEDSSISLDFPRGSLVSLSEGHRRLPKITTAVERFIRKEQIMRVDWSDEIGAYCVEISQDIDLPSLEVDVPGLVSALFRLQTLSFISRRHSKLSEIVGTARPQGGSNPYSACSSFLWFRHLLESVRTRRRSP